MLLLEGSSAVLLEGSSAVLLEGSSAVLLEGSSAELLEGSSAELLLLLLQVEGVWSCKSLPPEEIFPPPTGCILASHSLIRQQLLQTVPSYQKLKIYGSLVLLASSVRTTLRQTPEISVCLLLPSRGSASRLYNTADFICVRIFRRKRMFFACSLFL